MRSSRDLDRRTLLKFGAAGTAVAAINSSIDSSARQRECATSEICTR
jgi:TAT (twin-arginine translocation) pathway-exported protein